LFVTTAGLDPKSPANEVTLGAVPEGDLAKSAKGVTPQYHQNEPVLRVRKNLKSLRGID
jgi:hypothetical protein